MPNLSMTSKEDLAIQSFSKTRIGKKSTSKTTSAEQNAANNTPLPTWFGKALFCCDPFLAKFRFRQKNFY